MKVDQIEDMKKAFGQEKFEIEGKELSPEEETLGDQQKNDLDQWLDRLSSAQQTVLSMRFGLRNHDICTFDQIGRRLKLCRERVRQIQSEAIDRLLVHANNTGENNENIQTN